MFNNIFNNIQNYVNICYKFLTVDAWRMYVYIERDTEIRG